ncbi:FkbM family methyltransferase [Candidatus Nomurabacteria bacterium]|nr:FkbM family methyltransferase [Candidatus Nomurabacteria bacterium]
MKTTPKRLIKAAAPHGSVVLYRNLKLKLDNNFKNRSETKVSKRKLMEMIKSAKKIETQIHPKIIVSLTSHGHRLESTAPLAIASLFNQTVLPDKIILWLAHDEKQTSSLIKLQKLGLEIKFTNDIKSYKKLIPALKEFPESTIITVDDDVLYPKDWLEKTMIEHAKQPNAIIFNRGREMLIKNGHVQPYTDWQLVTTDHNNHHLFLPTGIGGVLYPPSSLDSRVMKESLFKKLAPLADDLWFWAMAELKGTKRVLVKDGFSDTLSYELDNNNSERLSIVNVDRNSPNNNDTQLAKILRYFPDLYKKIGANQDQNIAKVIHNNIVTQFNITNQNDWIQRIQSTTGQFYEIGMLIDIEKRLKISENNVIIDAGAYIGNHSLFFATHCNASKVISFEPSSESYKSLQNNIELNDLDKKIQVYNFALGDKIDKAEIKVVDKDNKGATMVKMASKGDVKVVTLDGFLLKDLSKIDLIKVDVEGMEIPLLKGALKTIEKFTPLLYIEAFEQSRLNEVLKILSPLGYSIVDVFNATPTYLFMHKDKLAHT